MGGSLSVLHLLNSDHRRGAEVFALDLATAMVRHGVGVTVRALTTSGADNRLSVVPALCTSRSGMLVAAAEIRRLIRCHDVVVGHGSRTLPAMVLGAAGSSTPVVYRLIGDPQYWTASGTQRFRVGLAMRRCAAVVSYYQAAASTLQRRYSLEENQVRVIGKGIDIDRWVVTTESSRTEARRRFSVPLDAPVVAYVGALSAEKNVGQLLRAVAGISGARLLIAGDGPERGSLESLATELGVPVDFLGAIDDPTPVYHCTDVVGLTSFTEGVPTVLLEAAASGLPAVATEVGGNAEVVTQETGQLVAVGDIDGTTDAIRHVLEHRDRFGDAAARRARSKFDLSEVAGQWIALLHEVVHDSAGCLPGLPSQD